MREDKTFSDPTWRSQCIRLFETNLLTEIVSQINIRAYLQVPQNTMCGTLFFLKLQMVMAMSSLENYRMPISR